MGNDSTPPGGMLNIEFGFLSWSAFPKSSFAAACQSPAEPSRDPCSVLYVPPTHFRLDYKVGQVACELAESHLSRVFFSDLLTESGLSQFARFARSLPRSLGALEHNDSPLESWEKT